MQLQKPWVLGNVQHGCTESIRFFDILPTQLGILYLIVLDELNQKIRQPLFIERGQIETLGSSKMYIKIEVSNNLQLNHLRQTLSCISVSLSCYIRCGRRGYP